MKVFFDENNNIVGTISAYNKTSEADMHMIGTTEATISPEIEAKLNDHEDPASINNLEVIQGEIVLTTIDTQ